MSADYVEITIPFNGESYENIQNVLYISGIESILEEKGVLKIYIDENKKNLIENIQSSLNEIVGANVIRIEKFENKNWNYEWEKSIKPVYIKDKMVVHTSWNKDEIENAENKLLIEIDPKMSFGTGHNETTQLMLELMCDYLDENDKFMLDYGTGTAVLSIAAAKLGVKEITAIDIDFDSIENAKEYIELNNVRDFISLQNGNISLVKQTEFDVIAANIIRSVIVSNLNHIHSKLKAGGKLFFSGVLVEEEQELLKELKKFDFEIIEIKKKAEWLGLYAEKK